MIPLQPQPGRPCVCLKFVPGFLFIVQSDGRTTLNVIGFEQLHPEPVAVIVTLPAFSSAVKVTELWVPELGLNVPFPLVIAQVAGFPVTVSFTSSPTPIFVRARFVGEVAIVCEAKVQFG